MVALKFLIFLCVIIAAVAVHKPEESAASELLEQNIDEVESVQPAHPLLNLNRAKRNVRQRQQQRGRTFQSVGLRQQRQRGRKADSFNFNINSSNKKSKKKHESTEEESSSEEQPKHKAKPVVAKKGRSYRG